MSAADEFDDAQTRRARERREAQRPLDEAGEGESEGFELAEEELIEHASHGDQHGTGPIVHDARDEAEVDPNADASGEADQETLPAEERDDI